ncbi:MAG: hypothetical protein ACKN9S_10755, partial [Pirellula sp.]
MTSWFDGIVFAKWAWAPAVFSLWAILSIAAWYSYPAMQSEKVRWIGSLLRSLGLGILCFCLLDPNRIITVPEPQANSVAVVLDNSRSMQALYQKPNSEDDSLAT